MLIPSTAIQSTQAFLPSNTATTSSQGNLASSGGTSLSDKKPDVLAGESKDIAHGDFVTLTTTDELKANTPALAPVFAEIWKNGAKVAEIDVHGGVNPTNGLVASEPGTVGAGGVLLAARRAGELVRSIGGEIRIGGQIVDTQTLDVRAKLKMAYGS